MSVAAVVPASAVPVVDAFDPAEAVDDVPFAFAFDRRPDEPRRRDDSDRPDRPPVVRADVEPREVEPVDRDDPDDRDRPDDVLDRFVRADDDAEDVDDDAFEPPRPVFEDVVVDPPADDARLFAVPVSQRFPPEAAPFGRVIPDVGNPSRRLFT
ncbi:hypothetical protein [Halogeometricum limi]|uniref:Uncharacterized protein n=1 Tax=Halogeometricum limi TaxID=555875 RepID=A0A1I6GUS5_9EURY|nr:hypothetical protein [Halogeometricum limi]SFR45962.1 hypothetical protein SAMN04488124_1561 [Halogeometricum limi]